MVGQKKQYKGYRDLKVYQLSFKLAMEIFELSKTFPKDEKYSLTDQIVRSSRSVPANIVEGWMKRLYSKMFVSKMIDSLGESGETEVWLNFALDCGYISKGEHEYFIKNYTEVNRMLFGMISKPGKFILKIRK